MSLSIDNKLYMKICFIKIIFFETWTQMRTWIKLIMCLCRMWQNLSNESNMIWNTTEVSEKHFIWNISTRKILYWMIYDQTVLSWEFEECEGFFLQRNFSHWVLWYNDKHDKIWEFDNRGSILVQTIQ